MKPELMNSDSNWESALAFILAGLSTLPGIIHMSLFSEKELLDHFDMWPWITGGILYILGAIIYSCKWPERFS